MTSTPIFGPPKPTSEERPTFHWSMPNTEALGTRGSSRFGNGGFLGPLVTFAFAPSSFGNRPFGASNLGMSSMPFGFPPPMPTIVVPAMFNLIHQAFTLGAVAKMDATSMGEAYR